MKVAILQSCYIPWKGYFDLINSVDAFVLYDDVQYTRRDWRNRNKIKAPTDSLWLTIPVEVKGKYSQRINETRVAERDWAERHWRSLIHAYGRAPHFKQYEPILQSLYEQAGSMEMLSQVNHLFTARICELLGIHTPLTWSSDYELCDGKSERLLSLCQQLNATEYVSGPAAKCYLDEELFSANGIAVTWYDYGTYPEYDQLYPPFSHHVSVIDLLVHTGLEAPKYMRSFTREDELVRASTGAAEQIITMPS